MQRSNWYLIVLVMVLGLVAAAAVVSADRESEGHDSDAVQIAPGECPRGETCEWCVYDVQRTAGEECPELEQLCVICDQERGECPDTREFVLEDKDCTLLVELDSDECEDCPRGVPTFVW